ncbi:MAG: right-handed parallel beta-helix repeat-containing protein [Microvirga sp.]
MASKICCANGNFTTAATWATVDATSLSDNEANSTSLTTSYVESATFTPGAITIDGIAVKIHTRQGSTGTFSIRLAQAGATVVGTEVTINVNDINATTTLEQQWVFLKFAAPVLLVAATLYTVSAKASSTNQITLRRTSTAGDWSRMLRTTTTAAPAAGDSLFILKEWTAAATGTVRSVTMNNVNADDFGSNASTPHSFGIGNGCTLAYGTTAATNYQLRLSGTMNLYSGSTLTIGTSGAPIPRGSTASLEFDVGSLNQFGINQCGATFESCGESRSSGKDIVQCLLNTDEAAAQTVLGVDTDTGWLNGDEIGIAPTARTVTHSERRTLSGAAGASSVTVSAGLTNAHSGTSPTQAEVILITRNVKVQSLHATFTMFWGVRDLAGNSFTARWTQFIKLAAIDHLAAAVSFTSHYCSIDTGGASGGIAFTSNTSGTVTISNLTAYGGAAYVVDGSNLTSGNTTASLTYITAVGCTNGIIVDGTTNITLNNLRVSGASGAGFGFTTTTVSPGRHTQNDQQTVFSNIIIHTVATGVSCSVAMQLTIESMDVWRCTGTGFSVSNVHGKVHLKSCRFWGNAQRGIGATAATTLMIRCDNCLFAGDSSFGQPYGWGNTQSQQVYVLEFHNCTFGVASGIWVAHSSGDIEWTASTTGGTNYALFNNCVLASATEETADTTFQPATIRRYQRYDGTTAVHKVITYAGTLERETGTFHTAAPSMKLSPSRATALMPLRGPNSARVGPGSGWLVPVLTGQTRTVGVWVRKNGAYNGNQPKLMNLTNPAEGIDTDTQLDIMTVGADTWEQLTATTPAAEEDGVFEIAIDVTGTAGAVFVDDFTAT